MEETLIKIGLIIQKERKKRKITQEVLASIVGCKRSFISDIENGKSNMNIVTLFRIIEDGFRGKVKIDLKF